MNPGDFLICKTELKIIYRIFKPNHAYEIESMEYSAGLCNVVIAYSNGDNITFSIINPERNAYFYLYDWFYTVEEARNIKIDELLR